MHIQVSSVESWSCFSEAGGGWGCDLCWIDGNFHCCVGDFGCCTVEDFGFSSAAVDWEIFFGGCCFYRQCINLVVIVVTYILKDTNMNLEDHQVEQSQKFLLCTYILKCCKIHHRQF